MAAVKECSSPPSFLWVEKWLLQHDTEDVRGKHSTFHTLITANMDAASLRPDLIHC